MSSGKKPINNTIGAAVEKIKVDNRISLRYYYKVADDLLQEANIHRQMKNIVDLYTVLLRFASLLSETIPIHRQYIASNQAEKSYYKKKLLLALDELESLKPQVQKRVNEIRNGHAANSRHRVEKQQTSRSDRPNPIQTTSLHVEIKQNWGTAGPPTPPRGSRSEQQKHQELGSSSSTTQYIPYQSYIPAPYETSAATAVPSAPPIGSLIIDDGPIPSHLIYSDPVDATSSMVENLNVEERGNTVASASCAICLDAPIEGACVPCGHMAGCMSCLNEIKAKRMGCPVCRAKVELVLRLYAV